MKMCLSFSGLSCAFTTPHHQPASARIQKIARALSNHRLSSRETTESVLHAIFTPPRSPVPIQYAPCRHIAHFPFSIRPSLEHRVSIPVPLATSLQPPRSKLEGCSTPRLSHAPSPTCRQFLDDSFQRFLEHCPFCFDSDAFIVP
ncbi:putative very-long-chain (3R)-3-hydroxyacyl-CoA dehydratase [Fusarium oxysporum f. sp. albedinis]|nr:putative very-long-chain (3R)-3-hydroxyacyl-CoA dehydratase [Fusarium oxysporum f. sp. albedinis]